MNKLYASLIFSLFFITSFISCQSNKKQSVQFQDSLKPGARVVTTSGMHAKIVQVVEDGVILETMSGKLKFEKAAISREFTEARFPETVGK